MSKTKNLFLMVYAAYNVTDSDYPGYGSKRAKLDKLLYDSRFYKFTLWPMIDNNNSLHNISEWCDENFEAEFCLYSDVFYYESKTDFMAFKLRWLE